MSVERNVEHVVAEVLQLPSSMINDQLAMQDVDVWDSLKHMELIVSLEETFGVQLNFEEIVTMQSVANIKRVLRDRGALN
ncbi:MAG TPA: acyl carrier protein [Pyrinomonadaceae bacterium]|jgi:acyl carrier protein|nr:acyl carrier protein [Pyrinomonadaceae bacterium]